MNPFSAFVSVLKSAGWPPPRLFLHGLVPVLVWHGLSAMVPEIGADQKLAWAVFLFLVSATWMNAPEAFKSGDVSDRTKRVTAGVIVLLHAAMACAVILAEPVWLQRWLTVVAAARVLITIQDIFWDMRHLVRAFPAEDRETLAGPMGWTFVAMYSAIGLMNETLIAHGSVEGWLVWLALTPALLWTLQRALVVTVLMSVDQDP